MNILMNTRPATGRQLLATLRQRSLIPYPMEICGTHTVAIFSFRNAELLPLPWSHQRDPIPGVRILLGRQISPSNFGSAVTSDLALRDGAVDETKCIGREPPAFRNENGHRVGARFHQAYGMERPLPEWREVASSCGSRYHQDFHGSSPAGFFATSGRNQGLSSAMQASFAAIPDGCTRKPASPTGFQVAGQVRRSGTPRVRAGAANRWIPPLGHGIASTAAKTL